MLVATSIAVIFTAIDHRRPIFPAAFTPAQFAEFEKNDQLDRLLVNYWSDYTSRTLPVSAEEEVPLEAATFRGNSAAMVVRSTSGTALLLPVYFSLLLRVTVNGEPVSVYPARNTDLPRRPDGFIHPDVVYEMDPRAAIIAPAEANDIKVVYEDLPIVWACPPIGAAVLLLYAAAMWSFGRRRKRHGKAPVSFGI
jgi:hypothetical protein